MQGAILGKTSTLVDQQLCLFFGDQLCCIFKAEKELPECFIAMRQAAVEEELKELLEEYLHQTELQSIRLEEMFGLLLIPCSNGNCDAVSGLKADIENILNDRSAGSLSKDIAMLSASQKVIQYKVEAYNSLEQLAASLGMEDVRNLLNQSLETEKEYQHQFSDMADRDISSLVELEL